MKLVSLDLTVGIKNAGITHLDRCGSPIVLAEINEITSIHMRTNSDIKLMMWRIKRLSIL